MLALGAGGREHGSTCQRRARGAANPYRIYVGRGQTLVHYPLRHNSLLNLLGVALQPDWQAKGWAIPATVEEFSGLFADFVPQARELIRCVPPNRLFKWGLRDREPAQIWTRDRVTMLGDAAHPFLPFLGQGACMAIEDGLLLGRAVAAAGEISGGFARYEAARIDLRSGSQAAPAVFHQR